MPCFVGRGLHLLKFPNFMETLGNETSREDKVWLAGHGDNETCIIQLEICPTDKNMPMLKKKKTQRFVHNSSQNMPSGGKHAFPEI